MKLSTYDSSLGVTSCRAPHVVPSGTLSSSTMMVMRMAMTPSLNASIRPVVMGEPYLQTVRPGTVRELDGVEAGVAVGVPDRVVAHVERRSRHGVGTALQRQRVGRRLVEVGDLARV